MAACYDDYYSGVKLKEGGPFGACITRNDVVVCCAHNTFFSDRDPTCHAEVSLRVADRISVLA